MYKIWLKILLFSFNFYKAILIKIKYDEKEIKSFDKN
jgi:hypothetical protein